MYVCINMQYYAQAVTNMILFTPYLKTHIYAHQYIYTHAHIHTHKYPHIYSHTHKRTLTVT